MNSFNKKKKNRWVLLRHIIECDDVECIHFDFLLEDKDFCRTWRLSGIPVLDGPYVDSLYSDPHNLYWLDIKKKVVSGNRGVATRVKKGIFFEYLPSLKEEYINLSLKWDDVQADMVIDQHGCRIFKKRY